MHFLGFLGCFQGDARAVVPAAEHVTRWAHSCSLLKLLHELAQRARAPQEEAAWHGGD